MTLKRSFELNDLLKPELNEHYYVVTICRDSKLPSEEDIFNTEGEALDEFLIAIEEWFLLGYRIEVHSHGE